MHRGVELVIDPHWSPEQALAVIELLDDLRDRIWAHYELALVTKLRDERVSRNDVPTTDPPF
nr:hypothetical protein [Aromatoleum bremense]